ncbi:MAG: DNA/RNA non-specific endonuclease [Ginsengibacter sp.]
MLVSVKQLQKETNQTPEFSPAKKAASRAAIKKEAVVPKDQPLIKAITKGNIIGKDANLAKRKEMISAKALEPTEFAFERSIGANDSLYSNFTELIALTKRKVGRIVIIENDKKTGYATGFMVSNCLMLTNWHVFKDEEMAVESELQFFYEYDTEGHPTTPVIFKFDTAKFFVANELLDYCFVAVQPTDVTRKVSLESIGYLYLDKALGKIGEVNKERLNIIHHPQGDYKQISIRENLFVGIDDTKIFYETDTAQGSSGSPVFNDQWQVVGLHHKSIAKMNDKGDYLDEKGKVIPQTSDGKIDVSKIVWLKNEGMRISVILKHVTETNPGNDVVATLATPPSKETLRFTIDGSSTSTGTSNNDSMLYESNKNIIVSVPVDALSGERSVEISLSARLGEAKSTLQGLNLINSTGLTKTTNDLLLEVAKADKEAAVDFTKCKGYDPDFLGVNVSLPKPKRTLAKEIARLKDKTIELKYFKYSAIFNAVTNMPAISAVNVEGDAGQRPDNSKRVDDWLRDSRIDIECQLTDKFYSKSKFDKGHMSRFEDANWDESKDEATALRNGIYSCFYTNACPQVVKLNRAGGLWGELEKQVLEKGIKKEAGKLARMTVFNGPIFNEAKDRIFKGKKIPMEFYKIILWLNDDKKLRATAFRLSQELLVGIIDFDEIMRLDNEALEINEEALDIDKNVKFKLLQCSIKSLGKATRINFSHIERFDTFKATGGIDEKMIIDEREMML